MLKEPMTVKVAGGVGAVLLMVASDTRLIMTFRPVPTMVEVLGIVQEQVPVAATGLAVLLQVMEGQPSTPPLVVYAKLTAPIVPVELQMIL